MPSAWRFIQEIESTCRLHHPSLFFESLPPTVTPEAAHHGKSNPYKANDMMEKMALKPSVKGFWLMDLEVLRKRTVQGRGVSREAWELFWWFEREKERQKERDRAEKEARKRGRGGGGKKGR